MPTITALSIINKAKTTLQDTTNVRWSDAELLTYLNDGQRAIAVVRPDSCSVTANITLVAGTRQTIPDAGTSLLRAVRNMGAGGTTPGRAIRHVPMELLDANVPNWHDTAGASAVVQHVVAAPNQPQHFYVYPPSPGGQQIEIIYAAPPAEVAAVGNVIGVDDVFATPLFDYVCFRAYTKDQETTGNDARAKAHFELFKDFLEGKSQADATTAPKQAQVRG